MNDITKLKVIEDSGIAEYLESKYQEITVFFDLMKNNEDLMLSGYNTILIIFIDEVSGLFSLLTCKNFAHENKVLGDDSLNLDMSVSVSGRSMIFRVKIREHIMKFNALSLKSGLDLWITAMESFYDILCSERAAIQTIYSNRNNKIENQTLAERLTFKASEEITKSIKEGNNITINDPKGDRSLYRKSMNIDVQISDLAESLIPTEPDDEVVAMAASLMPSESTKEEEKEMWQNFYNEAYKASVLHTANSFERTVAPDGMSREQHLLMCMITAVPMSSAIDQYLELELVVVNDGEASWSEIAVKFLEINKANLNLKNATD